MADDPSSPASYAVLSTWRHYRSLLEAGFGLHVSREPTERWVSWDGHRVHLDEWLPAQRPLGTVVLVHGGGGNGRLLAPLGDSLAARGWRVVAPDLLGYRLTIARSDWRADYGDWPRLVAWLAGEAMTEGPVATLGLSMGGLTALWAAQLEPRVRAVIATTLLDLRNPAHFDSAARWRWLGAATRIGFAMTPRLADRIRLPLRVTTPLETLTTEKTLQRYVLEDSLLGGRRVPARFFRTAHRYVPPRADFSLPCPLLLAHPGADRWTPTALSLQVFDMVPTPKTLRVLTNGAHIPFERPAWDELLEVTNTFLDAHLSPTVEGGEGSGMLLRSDAPTGWS